LAALVLVSVGVVALLAVGPRTGAYRTLTVLSASMRPTFDPGTVVVVRPTTRADLEVGDVITYRIPVEDRRVVSHRIVEILDRPGPMVVRTQGDANNAPDPWLARIDDDIVWRVEASVPWLGYGIGALREPLIGRALVLLCPFVLCMLALRDLWRQESIETEPEMPGEDPPTTSVRPVTSPWTAGQRSKVEAVLALAAGTGRVLRWTDDVASGRRWTRRRALHG